MLALLPRKITYRLYPSAAQAALMDETRALHCRAYNALLEEHRRRHEAAEPAFGFSAMCRELTAWRARVPALEGLNAQSLQVTARRAALAFAAFFRRQGAGETPGYPRFKALARFAGWGYKTHGDGWRLTRGNADEAGRRRHGTLHLTGIGTMAARGQARFTGTPKTAEVLYRAGKWYLSVTVLVPEHEMARPGGRESGAFDWGVTTLLTLAKGCGALETVDNPRWLKRQLAAIQDLGRSISAEEEKAKAASGKDKGFPVTGKLKRRYAQLRALHGKLARQRHDFFHQLSAQLVTRFGALATETLATAAMTKRPKQKTDEAGVPLPNGAAAKAGLNRGILDAAPAKLIGMIRYKAAEAGTVFAEADTRRLKPTQRCHECGALVKKALGEREHRCRCGVTTGRDENAARTLLRWLMEGDFWTGTVHPPGASAPA